MTASKDRRFPQFSLVLPKMVSKSNFRYGDTGHWRKNAAFERECALLLRAAIPEGWQVGSPSDELSKRPRVIVAIAAVTLLDAGNVSKSLLDAAEGVVFLNDASVWAVTQIVSRSRSNQRTAASFALVSPGDDVDLSSLITLVSKEALDTLEKSDASV
jgi:hypothetical protein